MNTEEPELQDYNDEDEGEDCTVWVCYSCSHVENDKPAWGGQCPRCGTLMNEEIL